MTTKRIEGFRSAPGTGSFPTLVAVPTARSEDAPSRPHRPFSPTAVARHVCRIVATAFSFLVFGAATLGLTAIVFPLCSLAGGDDCRKQARVQRVIHHAYRGFVKMLQGLGLIRTDWIGADALRKAGPHLIVANHPTLIDVVQLISMLPQADCVIGAQYGSNRILARAAGRAGYITNADGAAVVEACAGKLRAGRTVVLFPEGTRSSIGGMRRFRRGAAHVAIRAGVPLRPVVISCDPTMLRKGQPWWDVPARAGRYTITVLDPIAPLSTGGSYAVLARRLTATLRERIGEGLNHAERP